jgi:hypothetical protein
MSNKLYKILPVYFLVTGLSNLLPLGYLLAITGITNPQVLVGMPLRNFWIVMTIACTLLLTAGFLITLAYFLKRKPLKIIYWFESYLRTDVLKRGIFLLSEFILFAGIWILISNSKIPIDPTIYILLQPALLWIIFVAILTVICLYIILSDKVSYLLAELVAFIIIAAVIWAVQESIFPQESFWLPICVSMFFYSVTEAILVESNITSNFFSMVSQYEIERKSIILPFTGSAILAILLSVIGTGNIFFLVPVMLFSCGMQAFIANWISDLLEQSQFKKIWIGRLRKITALLLMMISLNMVIHPISFPPSWHATTTDTVSEYVRRFDCLRNSLPQNTRIGYLATENGETVDPVAYMIANYSLAPSVIAADPLADWVVVNFQDRNTSLSIIDNIYNMKFTIKVDCNNGALLIYRGNSK